MLNAGTLFVMDYYYYLDLVPLQECFLSASLLHNLYIIQAITTDHTSNVVLKAYLWLLLTQSCKVGSFKTKTLCIHNSTIWPVSYITSLVESLTRIGSRSTPLALFMTITGTLGRLHKGGNINWGISVSCHRWSLVPDATQWTNLHMVYWTCCHQFWHVSFGSRVTFSCQENLQQTPAGLTSKNPAWGPKCAMTGSRDCNYCT